jgi:hypothetical protein
MPEERSGQFTMRSRTPETLASANGGAPEIISNSRSPSP